MAELTEVEKLRKEKLVWLYYLECGEEGPCSVSGREVPNAEDIERALHDQEVEFDSETIHAIMSGKIGMSDELAAQIESAFLMPTGWLSEA